jgi:1-acyl-sn-glycerol-3-phosphate acyltransferase
MSPIQTAWYWFIRAVVKYLYFKLSGGMRVSGTENVPRTGAIIVASNHASYLDPPLMGCALPRVLTYMAKEELFRNRVFGWLIRSLGAFPVRRGAGDLESIRIALSILAENRALLVFPEGTRNLGQQMGPMNRGVEMLARKSGALVVPVGLTGTAQKWGKGQKPKWGGVKVRFGMPMSYADFPDKDRFAAELERRILELCRADGNMLRSALDSSPASKTDLENAATAPAHLEEAEAPSPR